MKIEKKDIETAKNILRAIRKATFNDMLGAEMFALTQSCDWLARVIYESEQPPVEVVKQPVAIEAPKGKKK